MSDLKTDNSIIELFWQRDERAITELRNKYGNYCLKIAMNILNDLRDAEETLNDVYLQIWNTVPPTRPARLSAYLAKITRNLSIDRYRAKYAQKRVHNEYALSLGELSEFLSCNEPNDLFDEQAITKRLNDFLQKQKRENRMIFVRRYFYCDNIAEIAQRFRMSDSKVKSILFRMRQNLKKYLEETR